MKASEANAAFDAAFPECHEYIEFWELPKPHATLDGDFTPEQLRLIADLMEKLE